VAFLLLSLRSLASVNVDVRSRVNCCMMIQKTRFVVIDTSTINKVAKDFFDSDSGLRRDAKAVVDFLSQDGWVPVISLHHLLEMVQHPDPCIVQHRLKFLQSIALLGFIKPCLGPQFPGTGSAVDVFAREVLAIVRGCKTIDHIATTVRSTLLNVTSGDQLIHSDSHSVDILRKHADFQHCEGIEIASISRADPGSTRDLKFNAMIAGINRSRSERKLFLEQARLSLQRDLATYGDKRLTDAESISTRFWSSVVADIDEIDESDPNALDRLLNGMGLSFSDISSEMTMEDVGFLATFRAILNIVEPLLRRNLSVAEINQNACPSWRLSREILRRQNRAARVSGSNLTDAHLAGVVWYVDAVEVDKRTLEFIRQITRDDKELANYAGRFFKCSSYRELPEKLREVSAAA
jgi:hypothetical protein